MSAQDCFPLTSCQWWLPGGEGRDPAHYAGRQPAHQFRHPLACAHCHEGGPSLLPGHCSVLPGTATAVARGSHDSHVTLILCIKKYSGLATTCILCSSDSHMIPQDIQSCDDHVTVYLVLSPTLESGSGSWYIQSWVSVTTPNG